jgi:hypothetical protein
MDRHTFAACHKTRNRIRRRWLAAPCQLGHQAIGADHQHAGLGASRDTRTAVLARQHDMVRLGVLLRGACRLAVLQGLLDQPQAELVLADRQE